MKTTVRTLEERDNEDYRALWLDGITKQSDFFRISPADDLTTGIPTRFTPDSFTLGAYSKANLVGIVSIERDSKLKANHKALVFRMFVHPGAAGRGVGRALLEHVISLAKQTGKLRYLYLTVLATNERAIHLYSSLGFKAFAREIGGVKIGEGYVDELQMACALDYTYSRTVTN